MYMGRKYFAKSVSSNGFNGVMGGFAAMAAIGFAALTLFVLGYYLIVAYNKPRTKLFNELQPMQYVGIILCLIACFPFIQYLCMFYSRLLK